MSGAETIGVHSPEAEHTSQPSMEHTFLSEMTALDSVLPNRSLSEHVQPASELQLAVAVATRSEQQPSIAPVGNSSEAVEASLNIDSQTAGMMPRDWGSVCHVWMCITCLVTALAPLAAAHCRSGSVLAVLGNSVLLSPSSDTICCGVGTPLVSITQATRPSLAPCTSMAAAVLESMQTAVPSPPSLQAAPALSNGRAPRKRRARQLNDYVTAPLSPKRRHRKAAGT